MEFLTVFCKFAFWPCACANRLYPWRDIWPTGTEKTHGTFIDDLVQTAKNITSSLELAKKADVDELRAEVNALKVPQVGFPSGYFGSVRNSQRCSA